jgi:hypothetical protein
MLENSQEISVNLAAYRNRVGEDPISCYKYFLDNNYKISAYFNGTSPVQSYSKKKQIC